MPYANHEQCNGTYKVINTDSGSVKGTGMTEVKADTQLKLLNAIEHDPDYVSRSTRTRRHPGLEESWKSNVSFGYIAYTWWNLRACRYHTFGVGSFKEPARPVGDRKSVV